MFTVALDGIWSIKRNLPMGGMMPGQQSRNSSLPQAKYYSRHGGLRSKTPVPLTSTGTLRGLLSLQTSGTTTKNLSQKPACSVRSHTYPLCHSGTQAVQLRNTPLQTAEKCITRLKRLTVFFTSYVQKFLVYIPFF